MVSLISWKIKTSFYGNFEKISAQLAVELVNMETFVCFRVLYHFRPTNCTKLAVDKSVILKVKRLWPNQPLLYKKEASYSKDSLEG